MKPLHHRQPLFTIFKKKFKIIFWEMIMIFVALLMVFPFIWMLSTSLKSSGQVMVFPPEFIPKPALWSNYVEVWTRSAPMKSAFINSFKITGLVTIGTLFNCSIAGYAFAKIKFPGRSFLFMVLLATMMIPGQVTLIPMYILMARIGWVDSHLPLIVPGILTNAFGVFLLRQFFLDIPDELLDAARIDGASPLQMYWIISMPLVKPGLVTLAIFTILGTWNSFLGPLIYLNSTEKFTIPLAINYFTSITRGPEWGVTMAAVTTALAPILIVYLVFQKYFIQGFARTGIKG